MGGCLFYIVEVLECNGIIGIVDVFEGMFGNQCGIGWIEKGFFLVDLKDVVDVYDVVCDIWVVMN